MVTCFVVLFMALQIGIRDVVFLLARASFYTTFLNNCGIDYYLAIHHISYDLYLGVSNGMLHVKHYCSQNYLIMAMKFCS